MFNNSQLHSARWEGGETTEKAATFEMFHAILKNWETSLPMTTAPEEIKSAEIWTMQKPCEDIPQLVTCNIFTLAQ